MKILVTGAAGFIGSTLETQYDMKADRMLALNVDNEDDCIGLTSLPVA